MAFVQRYLWLVIAMICLGVAARQMWPYTLDDAYISMQYAQEWLGGHGLVFSKGQRVEGYSNPLWVALLALGGLSGLSLPQVGRVLGVVSSAVTLATAWWVVGSFGHPKPPPKADPVALHPAYIAPCLAALLLALHPGIGYYATAGLETSLYGMLLLLGLAAHLHSLRPEASKVVQRWSLLALSLAAITRPEGPMFLVLALAHRIWHNAHHSPDDAPLTQRLLSATKQLIPLVSFAFVLPLGYLVFRIFYFGEWVPNTYFAKPGMFTAKPGLGWSYVKGFFAYHITAPPGWIGFPWLFFQGVALALGGLLLWLSWKALRRRPEIAVPIALCIAAQIGFVMYASGDWMIQYRLLLPVLAFCYILPTIGLLTLPVQQARWLGFALLLASLSHAQHLPHFWRTLQANQEIDHAHNSRNNVRMAQWMAKNLAPGATLVTDEIGAIGFYTKLQVIDQWGLVDKAIAKILHRKRFNPNVSGQSTELRRDAQTEIVQEMMKRKPAYVLIDYRGQISPNGQYDPRYINRLTMTELYRAIQPQYIYMRSFAMMRGKHNKHFLLFRRKSGQ